MNRKSNSSPLRVARFAILRRQEQAGLSLIELIVASLIVSVVILVIWSGLISLMNMSAKAEARSLRQLEVNQAIDFISEELRMARRVNATVANRIDGTTDISDLLNAEGFDLNQLGNYGDLALYLEIPGTRTPPGTCTTGPNSGSPPPTPSTFDRVIYDVRGSSNEWLGPRTLMRYGRLKNGSGAFDPCDSPISSDPIADALADSANNPPACAGTLAGGSGFHSCTDGDHTSFTFQHTLVDAQVTNVAGGASSRVESIQAATPENVGCQNEANLKALNYNTPQQVTFVSQGPGTKVLYQLDTNGNRQIGANISGNSQFSWNSYLTHPWIVTDDNGTCMSIFMPKQSESPNIFILPES